MGAKTVGGGVGAGVGGLLGGALVVGTFSA